MHGGGEARQGWLLGEEEEACDGACKDRSDVNRTFWERSPEEDSLLQFRILLLSLQHTSDLNLHGHLERSLNLDLLGHLLSLAGSVFLVPGS